MIIRDLRKGFSIIELLTVIAIIAILLAMILPSLSMTRESGRMALCANNLSQIYRAMEGHRTGAAMDGHAPNLPAPGDWVQAVANLGVSAALVCPSDEVVTGDGPASLEGLYIHQFGHDGKHYNSYLTDIFAGNGFPDNQLSYYYQGDSYIGSQTQQGINGGWLERTLGVSDLSELPDNVGVVMVEYSAMIEIKFGAAVTITSHIKSGINTGSQHWLERDGVELLELGGKYFDGDSGSITLTGSGASYGMNNQVVPDRSHPSQMMLIEYERVVVDVDQQGTSDDDFDEHFAPRHLGAANGMHVDGSIGQYQRHEVDPLGPLYDQVWTGRVRVASSQ